MNYASVTSYSDLYLKDYHGHRPEATSFEKNVLPDLIVELASNAGVTRVLDIGAGNGRLAEALRKKGLQVITADYNPEANSQNIHLDLTQFASQDVARIKSAIHRSFQDHPYLTVCFDVLEHIDREHLASAMLYLWNLSSEFFCSSISTRPSSYNNKYHCTILSRKSWGELFEKAGWTRSCPVDFTAAVHPLRRNHSPDNWLLMHWADLDPLRDLHEGEPWYQVWTKGSHPELDAHEYWSFCQQALDLNVRSAKREVFNHASLPPLCFHIAHLQDFLFYRPLLDCLERERVTVFVRSSAFKTHIRKILESFCLRNGVRFIEYVHPLDIAWQEFRGSILLSASESTVSLSHFLASSFVLRARAAGIPAFLLQHGIWVDDRHEKPIVFSSDEIFTWGPEHEHALQGRVNRLNLAEDYPRGFLGSCLVHYSGSPKFTESLHPGGERSFNFYFGIDRSPWKRLVLLGGNLHWDSHFNDGSMNREMVTNLMTSFVQRHPDHLFILKPHPNELASDYATLLGEPNVRLIDDFVLLAMDLQLSRLLRGFDVVISSLSTLLLDASICGKPAFQYDTGNRFSYAGIEPLSFEEISACLNQSDLSFPLKDQEKFISHYAPSHQENFYRCFAKRCCEVNLEPEVPEDPLFAALYAASSICEETMMRRDSDLVSKAKEQARSLRNKLDAIRASRDEAKAEIVRIKKSLAWKLGSPVRKIAKLYHALCPPKSSPSPEPRNNHS